MKSLIQFAEAWLSVNRLVDASHQDARAIARELCASARDSQAHISSEHVIDKSKWVIPHLLTATIVMRIDGEVAAISKAEKRDYHLIPTPVPTNDDQFTVKVLLFP